MSRTEMMGPEAGASGPRPSPPGNFRLPHPLWLAGGIPIALIVGLGALDGGGTNVVFLAAFVAGAALSPLAALSVAARRLAFPTTWKRVWIALAIGAMVSIPLAIALEIALPSLILTVAMPLRDLVADAADYDSLEEFFYSPFMVVMLVQFAVVAPLVEELVKPIGALVLARRLRSPSEAFIVGMAGGVAFAVVENMLYEMPGLWGWGEVWAGTVALRSIGSVMHPLTAGMMGVAWFAVRNRQPGAGRRLLATFALVFLLHALWNGGIALLMTDFGAYYFDSREWQISIYDIGVPVALIALLMILSLLMWRILWVVTGRLRGGERDLLLAPPRFASARQLSVVALALLLMMVPVGALAAPIIRDYLPLLVGG